MGTYAPQYYVFASTEEDYDIRDIYDAFGDASVKDTFPYTLAFHEA